MRRMLLAGLFALTPAIAFAAPPTPSAAGPNNLPGQSFRNAPAGVPDNNNAPMGSLGNGMQNGNEPGHVESPGVTKIDNDSRGPINDVQPGRGTNDTHQSAKPKPVR